MEGATRLWKADGMEAAAERIERRLVEETAKVREEIGGLKTGLSEFHAEMAASEGRLRSEITQSEGRLRSEMTQSEGRLRVELAQSEGRLRVEMTETEGRLRVELAGMDTRFERRLSNVRFDLVKWSFVFWLGQVVTMTAILSALLNTRG